MSEIWQGPLEKIDDYRWRIPKSYKPGMRVPGLIYADEKLLKDIRQDKAAEQVANVAFLPGIVNASLAMPDIHWGYGFCLPKGTKVLTNFGFYKPIEEFEKDWSNQNLKSIDLSSQRSTETSILKFIKLKPKELTKIVTKTGYEIYATVDHPFLTPLGMRPIEILKTKDKIAIFPFEGVLFEKPTSEIIISEEDIKRTLIKLGRKPGTPKFEIIIQKLKKRNLLPLTYDHPKLPFILKIMGFVFADASMNFIGKRQDGVLHFCGKPEDLEEVRKDLDSFGYTSSPIHFRKQKNPRINKYYNSSSFNVNAASLVVLLETLGVPRGSKVDQVYRVPNWIFKAPLWQKRLFLASLFGCELRMPHRRLERRGYFNAPVFPMAKREELIENGKDFLNDLSKLLKEFEVRTLYIDKRKRHINKKGEVSWALELLISPQPENLFNLWSKIGFEYNFRRSFMANVACHYLKLKLKILREKEEAIRITIPKLLKERLSYQKIALKLAGNPLTKRFIIDVCYELNRGKRGIIPRIPASFPLFEDYLKEVTENLGQSGMVWDEIEKIEKIPYDDFVYDFTVFHPDHNFIANNFVVSNCIGGVAATDPEQGGVISPAGVGYDINCLSAETKVRMQGGYYLTIKDLEKKQFLNPICIDFNENKEKPTKIIRFIKSKPYNKIYKITTEAQDEIIASEEHPFWTPDGMVKAGFLKEGSKIAISPFVGVEFEEPNQETILDEEAIKNLDIPFKKEQIIKELKKRNLLPLKMDNPKLSFLLKLIGYHLGDGTMYITKNKATVWFYGPPQDLALIREDIYNLGYTPSRVYLRERKHKITTSYDTYEFTHKEYSIKVVSNSFFCLLFALGIPQGRKTYQPYQVPYWIFKLKKWQKRLFLAGLFDAELSSPKALYNYNFYPPCFSMNKEKSLVDNGIYFLKQLTLILEEFGVRIQKIGKRKEYKNKDGKIAYRLRLIISSDTDNLINFYAQLGFEYNLRKKNIANLVLQYLKLKKKVILERENAEKIAIALYQQGLAPEEIYQRLSSPWVNKRFLERSIFEGRKTSSRIALNFCHFMEYKKEATEGLKDSCYLWEKIHSIEEIEYKSEVYDLTVEHPSHNFIANNFVVSNCGVRLLKTNFQYEEIKDKIKDLVYVLFSDIPSGVGSKGEIRVSEREEREILVKGARWAVEKGYGTEEDLECTEEYGAMQGADPLAVSQRAYERGKAQSGTLGSGNHFLEVQMIDQLYDRDICDALGLSLGQITIMIHSGSRGLGYQICDDYTRSMVHCLQKYNINVPDRQLSCAPVNSKEGQAYLAAMKCAANYAWANRQCLMYLTRRVFEKVFGMSWQKMGMFLIYDVAHNIAKIEKHIVNGKEITLCVHRKGATRAFGPGHPALPQRYKKIGQPVIIPGDMGRNSYLLAGTQKAMEETFGSTCHGAGRVKSRTAATKSIDVNQLLKELEAKGITVKASGRGTIVEEAPQAYKDVNEVVEVVHNAGISKRICRMRPLGVIKG